MVWRVLQLCSCPRLETRALNSCPQVRVRVEHHTGDLGGQPKNLIRFLPFVSRAVSLKPDGASLKNLAGFLCTVYFSVDRLIFTV